MLLISKHHLHNKKGGMKIQYIVDPGTNFFGDMTLLKELALLSKNVGATFFKPQLFFAPDLYKPENNTYYDLQCKCSLDMLQAEDIYSYCSDIGIECIFSCFDEARLRWIDDIGCEYIKIANRMATDLSFLHKVKEYGFKPIISVSKEHQLPFFTYEDLFGKERIMLWTVPKYPSGIVDYRLEPIRICEGISDHTNNIHLAIASTAIGANIIEKHIYSRVVDTPDFGSSISIEKLAEMINVCNNIEKIRYKEEI